MAGGKSKKAGSHGMSECRTCKMWVNLESCKGLTEMSQSERNKLVFDCWKSMVDKRVKMADVNMKMEEIKRLKAKAESLTRELEDERKLKGEDVRSKRKVDGDVNDGVRCISERDEWSRVNEKVNGSWAKVSGRRMIEKNGINDNEWNRINEKMNGHWIKMGRRINEMDAMKGEHDRETRMQGRVRPVIRICGDSIVKNIDRFLDMDDLIQAGYFLRDGVHLLQEGETKLSQRFICWIRATHLLMEGRMD
ncbi:hypothetical protein FHG87_009915 [Trinorchestia longiramus]|nr:hypothetical protein FHG87_009915 [Trinorchestia longiramus]